VPAFDANVARQPSEAQARALGQRDNKAGGHENDPGGNQNPAHWLQHS
jgi:hypothetical protein